MKYEKHASHQPIEWQFTSDVMLHNINALLFILYLYILYKFMKMYREGILMYCISGEIIRARERHVFNFREDYGCLLTQSLRFI